MEETYNYVSETIEGRVFSDLSVDQIMMWYKLYLKYMNPELKGQGLWTKTHRGKVTLERDLMTGTNKGLLIRRQSGLMWFAVKLAYEKVEKKCTFTRAHLEKCLECRCYEVKNEIDIDCLLDVLEN